VPEIVWIGEWGGTQNGWPEMTLPAGQVWVHHTVTNPTGDAYADFRTVNAIGAGQGHGGISYSFIIHPDGTIGEGQGLARGAHTGGNGCGGSPRGWNPCSFGVAFVGNYNDLEPTAESIVSFRFLVQHLTDVGVLVPGASIGGHRDAPGNATACPGNNLEAALPALREPYAPTPDPEDDEVANMYVTNETDPSLGIFVTDGVWKRHILPDEWAFIQFVSPDKAKTVPISQQWWDSMPTAGASKPTVATDVFAIAKAVNDDAARRLAG